MLAERSTQIVVGLVALLVLMRLVLPFVRANSGLGRFILAFWHPAGRNFAQPLTDEIKQVTLANMNAVLRDLAVILLLVRPLVLSAYYIPSQSMEPTLMGRANGRQDRVLVNRLIYRLRAPRRQEVVVFMPPEAAWRGGRAEAFVKRLIGLPGDVVEVRNHHAWVNGQPLDEPYLPANLEGDPRAKANWGPAQVPAGCYFFLGDNRANSEDSRYWLWADAKQVQGRAMCTYWPIIARDPNRPSDRPEFTLRLLDPPRAGDG